MQLHLTITQDTFNKLEEEATKKNLTIEDYSASLLEEEINKTSSYLTSEEIIQDLHITRQTLYTYIKNGKLKTVKLGKSHLISRESFNEFMANASK